MTQTITQKTIFNMVFHPLEFKMENTIVLPNTNGNINLQFFPNRMEKPLFCSQRQCIHLQFFFILSGLKLRNPQNTRASTVFEGETFFWKSCAVSIFLFLWCLETINQLNGVGKSKSWTITVKRRNFYFVSILFLLESNLWKSQIHTDPKALSWQYFSKATLSFAKGEVSICDEQEKI